MEPTSITPDQFGSNARLEDGAPSSGLRFSTILLPEKSVRPWRLFSEKDRQVWLRRRCESLSNSWRQGKSQGRWTKESCLTPRNRSKRRRRIHFRPAILRPGPEQPVPRVKQRWFFFPLRLPQWSVRGC